MELELLDLETELLLLDLETDLLELLDLETDSLDLDFDMLKLFIEQEENKITLDKNKTIINFIFFLYFN